MIARIIVLFSLVISSSAEADSYSSLDLLPPTNAVLESLKTVTSTMDAIRPISLPILHFQGKAIDEQLLDIRKRVDRLQRIAPVLKRSPSIYLVALFNSEVTRLVDDLHELDDKLKIHVESEKARDKLLEWGIGILDSGKVVSDAANQFDEAAYRYFEAMDEQLEACSRTHENVTGPKPSRKP